MTPSLIKTKTIKAVLFSDYYIEQTKPLLKEVVYIVSLLHWYWFQFRYFTDFEIMNNDTNAVVTVTDFS
jgi:hypothetical protein